MDEQQQVQNQQEHQHGAHHAEGESHDDHKHHEHHADDNHNKCENCGDCKDCQDCKCQDGDKCGCCNCDDCKCSSGNSGNCHCCQDCSNGSCKIKQANEPVSATAVENKDANTGRKPLEKVMIICAKAGIDSVYASLILANGARSEGIECDMFFTFFGLDVITKKRMEHLKVAIAGNTGMHMPEMVGVMPGMESFATHMMMKEMQKLDIPTVGEFLEIIKAAGGNIFGCKLAAEMFHLTREDMWEGVDDVLTVGQFYERATERSQIIFI